MEYIVSVKSSVIVDADNIDDAREQVDDTIEDASKRNCGGIEDEILANAKIGKIEEFREE